MESSLTDYIHQIDDLAAKWNPQTIHKGMSYSDYFKQNGVTFLGAGCRRTVFEYNGMVIKMSRDASNSNELDYWERIKETNLKYIVCPLLRHIEVRISTSNVCRYPLVLVFKKAEITNITDEDKWKSSLENNLLLKNIYTFLRTNVSDMYYRNCGMLHNALVATDYEDGFFLTLKGTEKKLMESDFFNCSEFQAFKKVYDANVSEVLLEV